MHTGQHYIVAIGIQHGKGYRKVLARHSDRPSALADIVSRSTRFYSVVYRDGTTGQRFSYEECRRMN